MNILIASGLPEMKESIELQLSTKGVTIENIDYVESTKKLIDALSTRQYDFVLVGYLVDKTDIWKISTLINTYPLKSKFRALILIKETCEVEIPIILAKEYQFSVVCLDDLSQTIYGWQQKTFNRHSLLIIEDDKDASLTAHYALQDIYDVDCAMDGQTGYDLWERKKHDLILLDLMLPKLSGEEVLEKVMAVNNNQSVIIVTALDKIDLQNKLLLNGASEYLCKPFSLNDLKLMCQALLNKSKLLHQQQYTELKMNNIRNKVWLIEYALKGNRIEDVKKILPSLKDILPNNLTEDEKINLITKEL
jgi:DNA-binding response OmpR family regulator